MKLLIWFLALFALAVVMVVVGEKFSAGYVLLVVAPYRIELSLNLLLALLALGFAGGYALTRLLIHTLRLPDEVRAFRARRREERARVALVVALRSFLEGRYGKTEKAARNAMQYPKYAGMAAVLAARAAHEMKAFDRRDKYFSEAEKRSPLAGKTARLVTQAELLLYQRRTQEALSALQELGRHKHTAALRLELKAQQQAKAWDKVPPLVALLEKRGGIEPVYAQQLKLNAHLENLKRRAFDSQGLRDYWQKVPAQEKLNNKVALAAARSFIHLGGCRAAHEIIEASLVHQWDSDLVELYGDCLEQDVFRQIQRAEGWLELHPRDATLLLMLGRLCMRTELWGKAQSYLEASLSMEASQAAHVALAQLAERMEKPGEACGHYRQSVEKLSK